MRHRSRRYIGTSHRPFPIRDRAGATPHEHARDGHTAEDHQLNIALQRLIGELWLPWRYRELPTPHTYAWVSSAHVGGMYGAGELGLRLGVTSECAAAASRVSASELTLRYHVDDVT